MKLKDIMLIDNIEERRLAFINSHLALNGNELRQEVKNNEN
jgi:hypothetical protein